METFFLEPVLEECKVAAQRGYEIVSSERKSLDSTLEKASRDINIARITFENSKCSIQTAITSLSTQLIDIRAAIDSISAAYAEDLECQRDQITVFSIALFGRTETGKSTLFEILTQGDGSSIGKGAQRTTREPRSYDWNGLHITDLPGVSAFNGIDDEETAYDVAKTADLILFLLTDDGIQDSEAACFADIKRLGKPIICIMNLKSGIPDPTDELDIEMAEDDINYRINSGDTIAYRKQFLSYASKYDQDWSNIPFVYVHLLSAFQAQHVDDPVLSQRLSKLSRLYLLEDKIIDRVRYKGKFFRYKNAIDLLTSNMIFVMEHLIDQSICNSAQGRAILAKKRKLEKWQIGFVQDAHAQIDSLVLRIRNDLYNEMADFVEEYYEDPNADKAWKSIVDSKNIQGECQSLLQSLQEQSESTLQEISREIANDLSFTTEYITDKSLKMKKMIDGRRRWNRITIGVSGGLSIAWLITSLFGAAISGPIGWISVAVGAIGGIGSFLFKSKEQKAYERRNKLTIQLKKSIDNTCDQIQSKMKLNFSSLSVRIQTLLKEMQNLLDVIFVLADTQRKLAWQLDDHILNMNGKIISEALSLLKIDSCNDCIQKTARIPGSMSLLMLKDGSQIPKKDILALAAYLAESNQIRYVFYTENNWLLIIRILGRSFDQRDVRIEDNIGIAHVRIHKETTDLINKLRLAQQFTKLAIQKEVV